MLLHILLFIMLAYLMLLTALFNAVCLHNAYLFFAIEFCTCVLFSCFVYGLLFTCYLFEMLFLIICSASNLLVFLILCT